MKETGVDEGPLPLTTENGKADLGVVKVEAEGDIVSVV